MGETEDEGSRPFSAMLMARGNVHKLKHGIPSEHNWTRCFYCEGPQTQEQVVQRGCRVSICGETQNSTMHGPRQPALSDPAWEVGLDE